MRLTDALLGEHGVFYAEFDRLDSCIPYVATAAEVREEAALLAAGLVSHARLEDMLLFDELERRALLDPALIATMREEHTAIAGKLDRAQATGDRELAGELLLEAVATAREHFSKEERLAFPAADAALGAARLEELASWWAAERGVFLAAPEHAGA